RPTAKPKVTPKAKVSAELLARPKVIAKASPAHQPKVSAELLARPKVKAKASPAHQPKAQRLARPKVKAKAKPTARPRVKSEVKPSAKPIASPQAKVIVGPKARAKPTAHPKVKSKAKATGRPTARPKVSSKFGDAIDTINAVAAVGEAAGMLPEGSSKPGDPGIGLVGDAKEPQELIDQSQKVEEKPYSTNDGLNTTSFQQNLDTKYRSEITEKQGPLGSDDLEEPLKDVGYNGTENARYRETNIYPKVNGAADPIAIIDTFPENGFIIAQLSNFTETNNNSTNDDNNNSTAGQDVSLGNIVFNEWVMSSLNSQNQSATADDDGSASVKSLRAFIGREVRSKSTIVAMQKAQKFAGTPLDAKATFKRNAELQAEADAFLLMEGTGFIYELGGMLKEHAMVR
ncbi:MAG: hypothetical protein Q9212_006440, partial [Teloschistes hypoglaucus]